MREKEEEDEGNRRMLEKEEEIKKGKRKGKSCKGTLYYSSLLKSKGRSPRCVGFSRSLQQVPNYIVSESEVEASKEGRSLTDFKYACVGYSVFLNNIDVSPTGDQKPHAELPVCVGLELLVDKRPADHQAQALTPAHAHAHANAHAHNKEDERSVSQPRPQKPTHAIGEEFLTRFTRNAGLVASGVARNMCKVGNYIKDSVDDILYPYRRRPK